MVEKIGLDPRTGVRQAVRAKAPSAGSDFGQILQSKMESSERARPAELVFSAHASERMACRGIRLTEADRRRIAAGVAMAREKGGRDALVLFGDIGLIVNVPSRTVVTALGSGETNSRVFTNIDSTVILSRDWAGPH